jgi:hypothetical protein
VDSTAAAQWNATVAKRLGELLKAAREQTRRKHGKARVEVVGYVCEAQQRGVFHPHLVLGYRTAGDRAALDTFIDALRRKRGAYGFGTGSRGSFDGGKPDRFTAADAARYVSKYLRPDRAKTSFVPLLEGVSRVTPRNPLTGRHEQLVRPVYVSTALTRITGVTMGFLRYRRYAFRKWGGGWPEQVVLAAYRHAEAARRAKRTEELEALWELRRHRLARRSEAVYVTGSEVEPTTLFQVPGLSPYSV